MRLHPKLKFIITIILLSALIPAGSFPNGHQHGYNEYLLKAVFLERFTRFVEWPQDDSFNDDTKPFIIGVIKPGPFDSILAPIYKNQAIKGKPVKIRYIKKINEIHHCHMLFIGNTGFKKLKKIIKSVRFYPVLTVSDSKGYAKRGVHINMYIDEKKQIRFEINKKAVTQSGLAISYLLLKVSKQVELTERAQ